MEREAIHIKAMHIIDKSFTTAPKSYIIQSILAVVALAIILYFVEVLTHAAIVAALGASTFVIFAMPGRMFLAGVSSVVLPSSISRPRTVLVKDLVCDQTP